MSGPRVAIVDDHALFRAGVRSELQQHRPIAGEAPTVDEAVALIAAERPTSSCSTCTCPTAAASR